MHFRRLSTAECRRNQSLVSRKHLDVSVWAEEIFGFIDTYLPVIQSYLSSSRVGMIQIFGRTTLFFLHHNAKFLWQSPTAA